MKVHIFMCCVVAMFTGGLICSVVGSSENPPVQDELAKIDSGFFISRSDAYGLQDELFKERLLIFLAEKGILTRSFRGLIYYYISEDAIAQIEDLEFKERMGRFVNELLEKTTVAPKSVLPRPYVVQPGDTLWDIAAKHGISVQELAHLNNMPQLTPFIQGKSLEFHQPAISEGALCSISKEQRPTKMRGTNTSERYRANYEQTVCVERTTNRPVLRTQRGR